MPTLTVSLNGVLLAQVCTDGFDVMSVGVHGSCVDEEFAEILMTGGKYPENDESQHLTWIDSVFLKAGDLVDVTIQEEGETLHAGKTIAQLYPEEAESFKDMDFTPTPALFAELRAKPLLRHGFRLNLETNHGNTCAGETLETEHGFGFSFVWNSHRPKRTYLSLHTYSIEGMERSEPMRYHLREYVEPYTAVRFSVDILP